MEIEPSLTETLATARRTVAELLRSHKAEDIVPANTRVVLLDASITLQQAFRALLENGAMTAPVIDAPRGEFLHVLTPRDAGKALTQGCITDALASWPGEFVSVDIADTLLTACVRLRDVGHALPIVGDGSVLHLLSHWQVLSFVRKRLPRDGTLFNTPITALGIGSNDVPQVRGEASLADAVGVMVRHDVSAVAVVDARGGLAGVVSGGDLLRVGAGVRRGDVSVGEIVGGEFVGWTCDVGECLGGVFELFERGGRHRLFVVDGGVVVGVVCLCDLLRYFLEGY